MRAVPFNTGWRFREKVNPFVEMAGQAHAWEDVTLPHDVLVGLERTAEAPSGASGGFSPDAIFEYLANLHVTGDELEHRRELHFDGIYRHGAVYVNGVFAGQRPNGYVPFRVRIDPFLVEGDNEIRVEGRTHLDSRWYSGAGIYREVTLLEGGPVHIAGAGPRITTPDVDEDLATVEVVVPIENDSTRMVRTSLLVEVLDPQGEVVARADAPVSVSAGSVSSARQRLTVARPQRWSVDQPSLYRCRLVVSVGGEQVEELGQTFGIRRLQWDATHGLRINGESVALRGGCIHHDHGILGAATFARAEERRVEILKAAGYNAIRSAHNAASSALLDACDRLGMLVMEESFDTWTSPKSDHDYSLDLPTWWRRDLTEIVERAINHPSVVMYSIGNEIPETGDAWGAELGRAMVETIRALDTTRPVTNGINPFLTFTSIVRRMKSLPEGVEPDVGINTFMTQVAAAGQSLITSDLVTDRIDESMSLLDIGGYNYADARYELDLARYPQRLILGTESNHANIEQVWDLVTTHPRVLGDFSWTAWDYLGEAGIGRVVAEGDSPGFLGGFPWRAAWAGDIDITGHRRAQSYYRETVWGLRVAPYLTVHRPGQETKPATGWGWADCVDSWSWPGHEGEQLRVDVYADADEVELLLDDTLVDVAAVGVERKFVATFTVTYQPGELVAVARRDGHEVGRTRLRTADANLVLRIRPDRPLVSTDNGELGFLDIVIEDGTGVRHILQDRRIQVTVEGDGVLQALGSADPRSEEDWTSTSTMTFEGRALAVVRPTGEGRITVRVEADGVPASFAELTTASAPGA